MSDYSKLTKDELGKKIDDAKIVFEDLKVENIKANSDRINKEKAKEDPSNLNLAQKLAKAMDDMGALAKMDQIIAKVGLLLVSQLLRRLFVEWLVNMVLPLFQLRSTKSINTNVKLPEAEHFTSTT